MEAEQSELAPADLLEPPSHAPGEPHPFFECPEGACPRQQPAYLFSGEFHETVVDMRIASCGVGLDLVWARRYRSRLSLPSSPVGNRWDHSYNIYLDIPATPVGNPRITIHDGNARPQVFSQDARGTWTAPRYHRSGEFGDDGRFVLTFADGGQWIFKSADESVETGIHKLWRIIDRHGNIVELDYDADDRLERVVNAVGQSLELEYDSQGHIIAVVAKLDQATERRVTYEHDAKGDLQKVTLPAIVDTVTDNDFVDGTTTTYTYADGKLLTIEDALGRVYLRNTYELDRLIRQQWGDADDVISMTYAAVEPTPANGFAITKAWLNDRMGRVSEHFFDADNQLVILREYTGYAHSGAPTDDVNNQPEGKLRADDPAYFETRYRYNADGQVELVIHPGGNATASVYEGDLDPSAPARTRGNLRERHWQGLLCESGFPPRSEYYEYEPGRGNEHGGLDFVTRATDARGNVTTATYDAAGNRTAILYPTPGVREDMEYSEVGQLTRHWHPEDQHGHRREVAYSYADDGHLRDSVVDPEGLALRTTSEYDAACNEVRRVDPRGNDKLYVYNARDQLIREWSPRAPVRAYTDRIYDANMNVVRIDYQALECDGSAQANEVISTSLEYDVLGELTATRMEIAPGQEVVNRFELDGNREVRTVQAGEAAVGNDPHNTVTTIYDERGLVFREIQAEGSALASTTQHDYDANGNETRLIVGLEGPSRTTVSTYDCADRLIAVVDPMGNRTEFEYDASGNVVEQRMLGEVVDVPGGAGNVLLERVTNVYDAMHRLVKTTRDHFNPTDGAPIGDGEAVTTFVHDGESRVIAEKDDNGHTTTRDFDRAGRPLHTIDAVGNEVEVEVDANGNVLTRTLTDVSSGSASAQVGVWTNGYDAQNNLIQTVDPMGNTWQSCYDSLGNLAASVDPRGNHTISAYDGLGRLLETKHALTDDGTGAGAVVGFAITTQTWDASDRLVARRDPEGHETTYVYDSLNRLTRETFADGTSNSFHHDVHGNVIHHQDGNGTILSTTYDALERPMEVDIAAGSGVGANTTFERFAYDGRSLLVRAGDDDSQVQRAYDSLGGLLSETQTFGAASSVIGYARDGVGNATTTWYPGVRLIDRTFDGRRRTRQIAEDDATRVEIEYLGPNVVRKSYAEVDAESEYKYDLGRRMIGSKHIAVGGGTIDHRGYTYDEAGNKRSEDDLGIGAPAGLRTLVHDSLGRMVDSEVSGSAATDRAVKYAFDAAGNRTSVSGDACSGTYVQEGADALVNQYSQTPCEDWSRDSAGNLIVTEAAAAAGRDRRFEYDHRGRLVRVWTADDVELAFAYDALGRKLYATGERYVYDDWNVIEEYADGSTKPSATYLYGDGLDERLQMVRNGESWWYFDDELGSTSAVVRAGAGALEVERYAYQDYGEPTFLTAMTSGNPYLFAGGRWLAEVGLYDMRTRHLDPTSGRFISWDTIGIWGDEENLGNGYTYVGNMPDTHTDPLGQWKKPIIKDCHPSAKPAIEQSLNWAQHIGTAARDWFNHEAKRKRKARDKDWAKPGNEGGLWWGKYDNTRFHRIKWNFRKIVHRIQKNVITFKCRTTGLCAGASIAWTHSIWNGTIRLCKHPTGFFLPNGNLNPNLVEAGGILVHEVSHNINAIGDKTLGGVKQSTTAQVQNLAKTNPCRASWNGANYGRYVVDRCADNQYCE